MTTLPVVRIVSLVPHATELLFALGLGDQVVAVTHECDYPEAADELPKITRDLLPSGLSSAEIDAAVRERTARGESIYELDEEELREAEPDLIVTQALCMVCAVSVDDVRKIAEDMPEQPRVISLDPKTFGETLGDVRTVAQATDSRDAALELSPGSAAGSTRSASPRATPRSGRRSRRSSGSIPSSPPGTGPPSSSRWPAARTCSASRASRPSSPAGSSSARPSPRSSS